MSKDVRVGLRPVRVDANCRGPKAGRARRRVAKVVTSVEMIEEWNEATYRPSSQRVAATFQRRNAARQGGSGSWLAPVGATSSASLGTRFARLGRFPMGRAHPQGAVTPLRYSALKTSTCLYLFYMVK